MPLGGASRPCTQIEWTKLGTVRISVLPCTVVQTTLSMYVHVCHVHSMSIMIHVH